MKLLPTILLTLAIALPVGASEIYVSASGAPEGNGTKSTPFQTLEEARSAVREISDGDVVVNVGSGHYMLRNGMVLSAADSGNPTRRISWRGPADGSARVSSGLIISREDLRPVSDDAVRARLPESVRDRVREVSLDEVGLKADRFKDSFRGIELLEIFSDGNRLPISRWPNGTAFAQIEEVTDNGIVPPATGTFVYRGENPARWKGALEDGVWLRGFWRVPWVIEAARVADINSETRSITFAAPVSGGIGCKYNRTPGNGPGKGSGQEPWEAINLIEEIDVEGEWAVRFPTNMLYILPPEGTGELLITDNREPVLSIMGASYLSLENLTVDSGLGDGIRVAGGEDVLIAGCKVSNVSRHGIVLDLGLNHTVLSCDTAETGYSGIVYLGGDRRTLTPGGHRILNNLVTRAGLFYPVPGIDGGLKTMAESVGNLVAHNRIHDCSNSGVVYSGNDNVFEYNEIYRIGLGSSDLGCFYTSGGWTSRGNIIRNNFVHHAMNSNAFYVDDGDSGDSFLGNVAYKVGSGGFVGGGHDQIFRHNIIIESPIAMHVDSRGVPRGYTVDDRRLRSDLDSVPYQDPPWSEKYPELVNILENSPEKPSGILIEQNLFVLCKTPLRTSGKTSELDQIIVQNNVESEDMGIFVNPAELDFSLKPDAPVFTEISGFPNPMMSKVGLYADAYRPVVPARDIERLRAESTERYFDSQTDVDASNKKSGP